MTAPARVRQPKESQAGWPPVQIPFQHGLVGAPARFTQPMPYGPAKW